MSDRKFQPYGSRLIASLFVALMIAVSGCQLFEQQERIGPPMGYREQVSEIRRIVSLGTPRETAVEMLKAAGIKGEYSRVAKTIFYCHSWKRPNGERLQMTVSLLFDAKDEFYAVDMREVTPHEERTGNRTATQQNTGGLHRNRPRTSNPGGSTVAWPYDKSGSSAPQNFPTDRRTPFETSDGQ